ncbi:MAG: hypothetical protein R6W80_13680 [Haliea sp.]
MTADTLSNVQAEIRRKSDEFEEHFRNGRARELVRDYYVRDRPAMSAPDSPLLTDHESIADLFAGLMESMSDCRLYQHDVRVSGERAYELGGAFIKSRDQSAGELECRYLIVWRNTEDGWRVETDFFAFGKLA